MTSEACPASSRNSGMFTWPVRMPSTSDSCRFSTGYRRCRLAERRRDLERARAHLVGGVTAAAIGANEGLAALLAGRHLRCRDARQHQAKRHRQTGQPAVHAATTSPLGADDHAGHRLDPDQMILHVLHAGNVLGGDDRGLALALVGDRAPKLDDAVPERRH